MDAKKISLRGGLRPLAVAAGFVFAVASGWEGRVRLLLDPEPWPASGALGVRATPTWFLLSGGRVEAAAEGWSRDDANALAARAAGLLGAAPVLVSKPGGPEPALRPG